MDYSENISNSPKYEPQDAHFSSKQISLHCTVVHPVDANVSYAYHLSDDKCHDSAFTSNAIDDLLETYHEYKNYPVLRLKSDNCSSQYCCRYIFPYYSELSIKLNKPVILYYGVNGQVRGLVDAMSGFGVKAVLRRAIVTQDFFYNTAEDLLNFLKVSMSGKGYYYQILAKESLDVDRENHQELFIAGCRKNRMISFHPSGKFQTEAHLQL